MNRKIGAIEFCDGAVWIFNDSRATETQNRLYVAQVKAEGNRRKNAGENVKVVVRYARPGEKTANN